MNDTLIVGWYGMQNTGDDALFAAACWGASRLHNAQNIAATAQTLPVLPEGIRVRPIQSATQTFRGQNRLRRYYHACRSRRILFGGGSVFQTGPDIRDKITMMKMAGSSGHRAVGVSLGPFTDSAAERACAEALKRMDFVGLRDAASYDIASSLAPDTPAAQTFDLAPLVFDAYGMRREPPPVRSKRSIGLALCPFESLYQNDPLPERRRLEKIVAALRQLSADDVDELVLIDFNGHPYFGDAPTHRNLISLLDGALPVRHLNYSPDLRHSLREIAAVDMIVTMRLHAAVFAYFVDTPTVILSYHPKCVGWAEQIGLSGQQLLDGDQFRPERFGALLRRGLAGALTMPTLAFDEARRRALDNWRSEAVV